MHFLNNGAGFNIINTQMIKYINADIRLTPGINITKNVRTITIFPSGSAHQAANKPNALISIGNI